jgi:hypothetical protein
MNLSFIIDCKFERIQTRGRRRNKEDYLWKDKMEMWFKLLQILIIFRVDLWISVSMKLLNTFNKLFLYACKSCFNVESSTPFYRVSWPLVAVGVRPIVLCHVSWDPPTFAWKTWWTFWTENTSEYCCVHENTLECCCVHQDIVPGLMWMKVRCVSRFHHMNITWIYGLYIMKIVLCTNFRMFLDQISFKSVLELVHER